ncbi:branched-chain amino acid ABC transporter permease/ATP-binding protein [Gordonia alkanivorans]|uniref:branched-chain amino acid ABC transporter permease/ATP-binding protein n=1 Tax=Gordonia alkanivorans TaxID=84096 RepID=UPI002446D0EF|nr:branched-chain amino acid ABC transporter permease/ATP-binding protein [Gordonia alkanivorans]MDH3022558.1 branched-chain amino acid ABC transporter permease/ATP-binding protein [Gordonia alkanivorans]MDJ0007431.1 branched-chain amino acid ABC transporter permease/ATP-binding protein [Gordonia alkanivorans]MDJ0099685.1 branched-chain amino acid ABC transporter permease/ATP-binding protein [Gordonia alkanivorans]MDJ0492819.1 branched-chain amino acid ABC transporter permease/ATP-binding prote
MTDHLAFLVLGLGNGAVFAALGLALVMTFKSSGVVNFATGAVALYAAYTYAFLRQGELLNPIPGFPTTISLGSDVGVAVAVLISVVIAAILGIILYLLVFRPMRAAPALAKAVAAIGLMLVIQALIALRVGENTPSVGPIFKVDTFKIGSSAVPTDRLLLAVVIVGLAICAGLVLRYTRFGVATEAAAESEKGALVTGLSPDRIAIANWALSSATAGLGGVLIAPIVPLNPVAYTMFIVPALAAALVGNFTAISVTVGAGLVIGMLQSEATKLQATWDWMPDAGVAEAVPLILIVGFLLLRGQPLPGRGAVIRQDLGRSPRPEHLLVPGIIGVVVAVIALLATSGSLRLAVTATMIYGIIALSQVVVTGYAGQVSLAQLTLAGVGAYALSRLTENLNLPFPLAPLLAACAAMVIGVIVGLPALRVRGLPLMVATLALAVFCEAFWFRNPSLNGGLQGAPVDSPSIFGIDLGIGAGEGYPRLAFGILCLVVLTVVAYGVAALRRSGLGASMLAVRANERSAAAAGINVGVTKLIAFAIASFLAGLGGALLAYQQTLATAGTYAVFAGIGLFAVTYVAGVTSISGAILAGVIAPGGVMYFAVDKYASFGDYYMLVSGILLVLTVVTSPDGLVGYLHTLPYPGRRSAPPAEQPAESSTTPVADAPTPPSGSVVLSVRDVTVRFGAVTAVRDVGFDVRAGEIVGLIGPNGAGKTTLIDAISGFASAEGSVALERSAIDGLAPHRRSRAGLGRTFQDIELYGELSVAENLAIAARRAPGDTSDNVRDVLRMLEIAHLRDVPAADLSQGQRQLVAVARVLAGQPRVALLDEPAAGLDSTESRWLGDRLRAARAHGVSMVLVDHDMDLVLSLCDRVIVLDLGEVIADGTPDEIRTSPAVVGAYLGTPSSAKAAEPHAVKEMS